MRFNVRDCLCRFGLGGRDVTSGDSDSSDSRSPRKVPGPEFLSLVALFGAIDAVDSMARPDDRPAAQQASESVAGPGPGLEFVRSTFAIHWEPMDRDAALLHDVYLSDGWVRIPLDRSAT